LGLAFARGVSTRESPDQLSGRGVGMDVVKESVEATGGEALLESEPGRGARVVLRFPYDGGEAATAPREGTHTSRTEDGERPVAP
jgi:signal transduction histidine kinase